jgi:hypothetical protein
MSQDGRQITYDAVLYAVGAVFGDLSRSPIGARFAEAQEARGALGRGDRRGDPGRRPGDVLTARGGSPCQPWR